MRICNVYTLWETSQSLVSGSLAILIVKKALDGEGANVSPISITMVNRPMVGHRCLEV